VDHRKLLYGSDYPLLILPKRQREPDFGPFIAEIEALGLSPAVRDDIMGNNAARLLGLLPPGEEVTPPPRRKGAERVIIDVPNRPGTTIGRFMAVSAVARAWPETVPVFEKYGIPWHDSPVPYWEPIAQAAAARGWGPQGQARLLQELNEAIGAVG
jgi:hypothetical protein